MNLGQLMFGSCYSLGIQSWLDSSGCSSKNPTPQPLNKVLRCSRASVAAGVIIQSQRERVKLFGATANAMAAASAAEETSYDLSAPESLLGFLEDAGIRLVRLEYLIELSASGRPLPRRQEAEKETTSSGAPTLVDSSELKEVRIDPSTAHMSVMLRQPVPRRVQVHVVSISHMWESMQHPDPWRFGTRAEKFWDCVVGVDLQIAVRFMSHHLFLLPLLARYQLDAIVEEFRPRLLDSVVRIFYDFVSLHQYARNEEQERLFRRALRDIFVMYSHDAVEVHRIETLTPESVRERCVAVHGSTILVYWKEKQKMMDVLISKLKSNETPYQERGWCRSEKEWSSLRTWMKGENPVPLPPDMFRARMQQLKFTHREDSEKVFKLQAKVFHQKAASTTRLLIENLDEDKIAALAAALPFYTKLQELVVRGSQENAWKAALAVVESGACSIEIACENVPDEDAVAFAADLSKKKCNHLEQLHVKCETIDELGRQALEQMMTRRRASLVISTTDRSRGYVTQGIEPAVASETCVTLCVLISKRRQPPRPAEAMAAGPAQAGKNTSASGPLQSVPQHAEASRPDMAQQTVSVHCLAGSSFELETLVLTSGGCVINHSEPLLHQVQHGEITYVVQKLGAGRAARSWQRLLEEKTLSDTDVVAFNETVSLTWDQSLEGIQLPSSLQSLTFGREFNQSLEGIHLPSSLQSLTFGAMFNQSLEGIRLPSSLQSLTFGFRFNQSVAGIQLPSSLQSLMFGTGFNQSLQGIRLPSSLQSLTIGDRFNRSLQGIQLPSSLQSLTFGDEFNQSLESIQLPSSLQSLTFGFQFNQSLEGIQLPSSLQSLTIGDRFNRSLQGIQLPSSLQSLTFGDEFNQSLESIQLPSSLQSLTFGFQFNQSLEGIQLPSSLQSLTFGREFNQSMEGIRLPSSLQSLTFGWKFIQSLDGIQLPSSLQSLTFGQEFNQSLVGVQLPSSLQSLTFGNEFNQSLEGIQLPSSLQSLTFGNEFNQSLESIQLPSSLQSLTFGFQFNQSLEGIQLPSSLQSLTFGREFNQSLEGIQLPSSLQSLTIGDRFNRSNALLPTMIEDARYAAVEVAKKAPEGSVVVAMIPDTGERYLSTQLFASIDAEMNDEELAISKSTPNFQY
eukprot:s1153_g10.t1